MIRSKYIFELSFFLVLIGLTPIFKNNELIEFLYLGAVFFVFCYLEEIFNLYIKFYGEFKKWLFTKK